MVTRRFAPALLFLSLLSAAPGCTPEPAPRHRLVAVAAAEDLRVPDSPLLVEVLDGSDEDDALRARAARAMGRIQSPHYVPALAKAVERGPREVTIEALFALGQLGLARGAEIPPLAVEASLAATGSADVEVAAAALDALGKLADPAVVDRVVAFLASDVPALRAEAAAALFRYRFAPVWRGAADEPPSLPPQAVEALIRAFDDPEPEVRRAAVYAFSRFGEPTALAALERRFTDGDPWTRLFALRAWARSEGATTSAALERVQHDPLALLRAEAVAALAAVDGAAPVDAALADDPDVHVRAAVATALAAAQAPAARAALARLAVDPSATVRAAALVARAGSEPERAAELLVAGLADDAWPVRAAAAGALVAAGAAALSLLDLAFADPDPRVRTAAIPAAAALEGADGPRVTAALESDDLAARGTAAAELAAAEPDGKLERLARAYRASAGAEWVEVRETLATALGGLAGADPLLREIATDDPAPSVRRIAREATGLPAGADDPPPDGAPSHRIGTRFDGPPVVLLETTRGPIEILTFPDEAPIHVAAFVERVRAGFYDGLEWHRVVPGFVIQGGDPRGDGWGSGDEIVRDEINRVRYHRGTVGMPKAGKDTGGCQLFITHVPTPHLDGNYTVFGVVRSGMDAVDRIEVGDAILRARVID